MVVIFASLSALTYGAADFFGGLASRKNSAITVVAWSQGMGLLVALIAAPLLGSPSVVAADLIWGAAAGICGAIGVGILYRGLAVGLASIISPVAALTGAVLPVFYGIASGEQPALLSWVGVALALPAILLLSLEKEEKKAHVMKSFEMGFMAGLGFSGFFILIAQTGDSSGMWPLVAARSVTVPLFFMITMIKHHPVLLAKGTRRQALFGGALDMGANLFYLMATRSGLLVTAVVITALYPAPTVVLQRIFIGEKLRPARMVGLMLAIAGAALIGIGG
ncbi:MULTISPECIES: DMT family transporter [unclassified Oceanispirochaeta]|uniref:DMT family transporter n=1 Tax=unclassified Oceanispirochaeta TaxID=2635722 RepID=UPI000E09AA89|nr:MULTISPECIES: DMT family transporter [unclassified Oceanispirochaeta]MBF9017689.1 DMT family transporter [Oceanispirochaeta sp. M2]NPD72092.1 DMT family transporter [Oceanispirochaeta sp. M1]RDG32535.1 DMT family transporter [Oceanispirochaeta sp. M1]